MAKSNILVFPCGSEIGLEIYRAFKFSKDFEIFGAASVDDHGSFVYQNYIAGVPFVDDDNFINAINAIVEKNNIEFILPAHDSVVLKLARHSSEIRAKIVSSPLETCEIARSKKKTYETLSTVVKVPEVYTTEDDLSFPVFLKPDIGQGSKGVLKASGWDEVRAALAKDDSLLVLEYLTGDEYTVDCLTGNDGELLYAQARERHRVVNGISVNSVPAHSDEFQHIAEAINAQVKFIGVWFFQVKRDRDGVLTLLEIAPRVAGTMALSRMQGANLPLLSVYLAKGVDVKVFSNDLNLEIDRALENRYKLNINFDSVYVDFDDAIIVDAKVNYLLIAFLYKMVGMSKRIILITKHTSVVVETLRKHKIDKNLFDEIIHLEVSDDKSLHVRGSAIFIDDSFSERRKVHEATGVPVFDISEVIELL